VIGADEWRPSDDMFGAFLAGVDGDRLTGFERNLYRHHRYLRLLEEQQEAA
jgi:hypothetical protein